ncbi:hypothetical protein Tco_0876433 [Tanacetum coccineum]|uniref:Uncharacterized protein n=1 Tax=Tanacetum coccineum TaxID=301880 RepID=A0ABQ5BV86_9ASTR
MSDVERVDMGSQAEASSSSKRDMGSYISTMKPSDVKALTRKYKIPRDLHPVAVSSEWTMDRLTDEYIGLYEQYFEFAGLRKHERNDPDTYLSLMRKYILPVIIGFTEHVYQDRQKKSTNSHKLGEKRILQSLLHPSSDYSSHIVIAYRLNKDTTDKSTVIHCSYHINVVILKYTGR